MLPDTFGGIQLAKVSYDGSILADDPASLQLKQFLAANGKAPSDFQEAASSDQTNARSIAFVAFRVAGIDGSPLSQAIVSATVAANPDLKLSTPTVNGRQVIRADQASGVRYLWVKDDIVFGVQAINEALANEGLAAFP